jgi:membrane associated rhomboid family serine protease
VALPPLILAISWAQELIDQILFGGRFNLPMLPRGSFWGVLVAAIPVWWFWPVGSHGLSGVNYGLLGYLLVIGWLEKRPLSLALSLFALVAYGGLLPTLLPFLSPPGVSWIGHVSGFLGGVLAALAIHREP